jgi:hypothetical protein
VVDVTQPLGLSTKLAPTYVRRTLAGENGITYKYLGLRMFSHPWQPHAPHARSFPARDQSREDRVVASGALPPPLPRLAAVDAALASVRPRVQSMDHSVGH